jgi:hypothetical protein
MCEEGGEKKGKIETGSGTVADFSSGFACFRAFTARVSSSGHLSQVEKTVTHRQPFSLEKETFRALPSIISPLTPLVSARMSLAAVLLPISGDILD